VKISEQKDKGMGWGRVSLWITLFSLFVLSGCGGGSQTPLPELSRLPPSVLSQQEQQRAIRDLEAERARLDAEAAKSRPGKS